MEHARESGGAGNGGNLGLYNRALGIRMFMPWLVIRKLSERNRQLEQKYQVMVNYTLNLREWYDTEKSKVGTMNPDTREPFISLLSNETLDKYYSKHAEEITQGIKLSALFKDGYSINDSAIVAFQNKLKDRIIGVLDESLKGFSVYKYLTGKTDFEFTKERKFDIHEMLNSLEGRSQVFIRIGASPYTDETINSTTTVLMSSDINQDIATWNNEFQRDFTVPVSHIDIMSPFKLSFLQMRRLPLEECLDLYNPNVPQWQETEEEPDPLPVVPPEEEEEVTVEENAPVEDAPVEDTPADTEEEAPAEEEVTPTEEEVTPAEEEEVPAEEELAPAEEEAPTEEEVVPAEEEVAPAEEEVAPAEEEEVPTEEENPQEPAEEESPKQ